KDIYEHIEPFKKRRAGKLSGGMKQKLALCCALIHRPEVLFLDEPTTGVDAVSRKEFWGMLRRLKEQGITILVSTPYMDEATLCERIALIQNGRIMSVETPDNIIASYPHALYAIRSENMNALLHDLRRAGEVASSHSFGDHHHITFRAGGEEAVQQNLLQRLREAGHRELSLQPIRPTIEDCFIQQMPA
ncbi:MAG TPA: ATP-binding cassette domain-containing protein, partial [Saprospiraceae bacterium]|nr:ATP-binding cassette domain-containing protein [Saprospiraceae bacterium]